MSSEIRVNTIAHSGGTSALTIANNGSITPSVTSQSAQSFRLSQNITGSNNLQTFTPFEEADTDYTRVGSANWTVSSGVFSVATTGT